MNIYGIQMEVEVEKEVGIFKKSIEINTYCDANIYPVLADWDFEAIHKFENTERYKNVTISNGAGNVFYYPEGKVKVKIVSVNSFTFDQLKKHLPADDFMEYCKNRLGLNQIINEIIK